jgi:uncharacterized membrane protein
MGGTMTAFDCIGGIVLLDFWNVLQVLIEQHTVATMVLLTAIVCASYIIITLFKVLFEVMLK